MKMGFVLPLVFFLLLAIAAFFIYSQSTIGPSQTNIDTAHSITRYPNSQSWEIKDGKSVCPFKISDCSKPPANIKFSSADSWPSIYGYYVNNLKESGWQTNTFIVTSVPTSVVFTNGINCEATLKQDSKLTGDSKSGKFLFTINCP